MINHMVNPYRNLMIAMLIGKLSLKIVSLR